MKVSVNLLLLLFLLAGCTHTTPPAPDTPTISKPGVQTSDYLFQYYNEATNGYGYKNAKGEEVIHDGKYKMCFTDTFKIYAIVIKDDDYVAIDRQENVLYKVFRFDSGSDDISEGLFRMLENNKIGYADSVTGKVVIKPQFDCAYPFKRGIAKVSNTCTKQKDGDYTIWQSNSWYYIDKTGKKVEKPDWIEE